MPNGRASRDGGKGTQAAWPKPCKTCGASDNWLSRETCRLCSTPRTGNAKGAPASWAKAAEPAVLVSENARLRKELERAKTASRTPSPQAAASSGPGPEQLAAKHKELEALVSTLKAFHADDPESQIVKAYSEQLEAAKAALFKSKPASSQQRELASKIAKAERKIEANEAAHATLEAAMRDNAEENKSVEAQLAKHRSEMATLMDSHSEATTASRSGTSSPTGIMSQLQSLNLGSEARQLAEALAAKLEADAAAQELAESESAEDRGHMQVDEVTEEVDGIFGDLESLLASLPLAHASADAAKSKLAELRTKRATSIGKLVKRPGKELKARDKPDDKTATGTAAHRG